MTSKAELFGMPLPVNSKNERADDSFGLCPVCHSTDGYLNVYKTHYFTCHTHKKFWNGGYGLFSTWQEQTEEDWNKTKALLQTYDGVVSPFFWPPKIRERIARVFYPLRRRLASTLLAVARKFDRDAGLNYPSVPF